MNNGLVLSEFSKHSRDEYRRVRQEYADLLLLFNQMKEYEGPYLSALYLQLIGQLQYELLQLQVDVKTLKLRRSLLQAYINRDETPDLSAIRLEVEEKVAEYNRILQENAERLKAAKDLLEAPLLSEEDTKELKSLYKMLVKALHPDLHPNQSEEEENLFLQVQAAYSMGNLEKLREFSLMVESKNYDYENTSSASDLEQMVESLRSKVQLLKDKIKEMEQSFPFAHRQHLADKEWIEREQQKIKTEIEETRGQKEQIERIVTVMEEFRGGML